MKKFLGVFVLLTATAFSYAEMVSSVNFNPSRMGTFSYLKVADKANLKGGLSATTMNISTSGTITATTDSSSRVYEVPSLVGASGAKVQMNDTVFHGNTSTQYGNYQSQEEITPTGLLPKVEAFGGTQTYQNDSFIHTLDAVNMLKMKASTVSGTVLSIMGDESATVSLYGGDSTAGFKLAGNDIPEPSSLHTNNGENLNNCELIWQKRKTNEDPAQEVWLLAVDNCNKTPGSNIDVTGRWWTPDDFYNGNNYEYPIRSIETLQVCIAPSSSYTNTCSSEAINSLGGYEAIGNGDRGTISLPDPTAACKAEYSATGKTASSDCEMFLCAPNISYSCSGNALSGKPYRPCYRLRLFCTVP